MSNKRVTKTSKEAQAKKVNEDAICPECNKSTGAIVNTIVEGNKVIKQYRCIFPNCGCEYEIEESHDGTVFVEAGTEDKWKSGGIQTL